jgi:hypothetical protein
MASDIDGAGSLHRHITTRGGARATAARIAQLDSEVKFPAKPAMAIAETQIRANEV